MMPMSYWSLKQWWQPVIVEGASFAGRNGGGPGDLTRSTATPSFPRDEHGSAPRPFAAQARAVLPGTSTGSATTSASRSTRAQRRPRAANVGRAPHIIVTAVQITFGLAASAAAFGVVRLDDVYWSDRVGVGRLPVP
jgi:hypothetical protein